MILTNTNISTDGSSALASYEEVSPVTSHNYRKGMSQEVFPFKNKEDIKMIKDYLTARHRYRDHALFSLGINTGMRIGDILNLRWSDILDSTGEIKDEFKIREHKTGKFRTLFITSILKESLTVYRRNTNISSFNEYIFKGQGTEQIKTNSAYRTFKRLSKKLKINFNVGTHSLRKTFGYHQYKMHSSKDPLFINELQEIFNHESSNTTLRYIGIAKEKQKQYYEEVQL